MLPIDLAVGVLEGSGFRRYLKHQQATNGVLRGVGVTPTCSQLQLLWLHELEIRVSP